jgi:alkanesulfonate monooxygenase SsuD/methylene tetrahydromethanopterin reductase-like flavin-dependent oxidoreductase (luciferase family)
VKWDVLGPKCRGARIAANAGRFRADQRGSCDGCDRPAGEPAGGGRYSGSGIAPAGTPEQVAKRLQEYVDAGVRYFIISPAAPADTLEIVTLAAEEVLPRLTIPPAA